MLKCSPANLFSMFRRCACCQCLLGESAPFDDDLSSHGMCASCERRIEANGPFAIRAMDLFQKLFKKARCQEFTACSPLV